MRPTLAEVARTAKSRDSWWTVWLIDPLAIRLVWLVAPYRWVTPNRVTVFSSVLGLVAAGMFLTGERAMLIAGAAFFYLSFVVDCVDGKLARLRDEGSFLGAWLDFFFDRVRFLTVAGSLYLGQYLQTHDDLYIMAGVGILLLDLLHYVNGSEIQQLNLAMRTKLAEHEGHLDDEVTARPASIASLAGTSPAMKLYRSGAATLQRLRIRPRLFSGVELEQIICVVAPLTGAVLLVTTVVATLHLLFEIAIVALLIKSTRDVNARVRRAKAATDAAEATPLARQRTSETGGQAPAEIADQAETVA